MSASFLFLCWSCRCIFWNLLSGGDGFGCGFQWMGWDMVVQGLQTTRFFFPLFINSSFGTREGPSWVILMDFILLSFQISRGMLPIILYIGGIQVYGIQYMKFTQIPYSWPQAEKKSIQYDIYMDWPHTLWDNQLYTLTTNNFNTGATFTSLSLFQVCMSDACLW